MRLCPQQYDGMKMLAVRCGRCSVGWNKRLRACTVETGAEHLPLVSASEVPDCPIQGQCQHQVQSQSPCAVRARGMICQSALKWAGMSEDESFDHPLSFHASLV
jgi:hypothetical protein